MNLGSVDPPSDCELCPRLAGLRGELRTEHPDWHNAPVASFGPADARLLIVGLAPGKGGANRTGRPFTGDVAGDLLYATMAKFSFSQGRYDARPDDGLRLSGAMITNAVRCLPPENKPVGAEIANCRPFLSEQIEALADLKVILCLGRIAHESTLRALGIKLKDAAFKHGAHHPVPGGRLLIDSYHCSRYNTNTRRLTTDMFEDVFADIRKRLDDQP